MTQTRSNGLASQTLAAAPCCSGVAMTDAMSTRQRATLPNPLTSFVGRERDIAHVSDLLHCDVRLVTLTGPGGVGKTRLALKIGQEPEAHGANAVIFVPLAAVTEPGLLLSTIARSLEIPDAGGQSMLDRLVATLRNRPRLLVLDNFEQLLPAAPVVTELLTACPTLSVLVTSRTTLGISGEQRVPVRPLAVPAANRAITAAEAERSDAVQLFMTRA
ncbi:MAG: AAA family ATPase [Thermomicrobiales bacterium]